MPLLTMTNTTSSPSFSLSLSNAVGCILLLLFCLLDGSSAQRPAPPVYTAFDDASWAVTTKDVSSVLGSHVEPLYSHFIDDCQEAVGKKKQCSSEDDFRLTMNTQQPSSVYNYTKLGYKKIRAPNDLYRKIMAFYKRNKGKEKVEWDHINTYHNMWESPPSIVHLNQRTNDGGGMDFQAQLWSLIKPVLQEWTGQLLSPVSLYGIRIYHNNSILAPHVDRMPLVASCIINVEQDVDEDWPLEVYGHDGVATNVTMQPGDMVLYESHSVIHGRPFPLKGRSYANVFAHFEPIGPLDPDGLDTYDPIHDLPPYLIPGSKWEKRWRGNNPNGWKGVKHDPVAAAVTGDVELIKIIMRTNPESLHKEDKNGWRPIHEAVRGGQVEAVQLLLLSGADKDHVTKTGVTPLNIAKEYLEKDHPMIAFLEDLGAQDLGPEL